MATKQKKTSKKTKPEKESALAAFSFDKLVPSKYQTPLALLIILIVFLIYFYPLYFGGKTFQSGDITTIKSYENYVTQEKEGFSLWNPYVFCGMPAYATSTSSRWFDIVSVTFGFPKLVISKIASSDYAKHTVHLFFIALAAFFFMRSRKVSIGISLFVGLMTAFSTGVVVFLMIGHITKLVGLTAFPIILMILSKYEERIEFFDTLILIIFLHYLVLSTHIQIIFYVFSAIGLYYLSFFIFSLIEGNKSFLRQLFKSAGVFIVASVIAIIMSFDVIAQLYEYTPYSTRGTKSILEQGVTDTEKPESDFYEYATNWSFSPGEVLTWIIPSYYGFGKSVYKGPLSQNRDVEVNTYFGQMPFVDVAMYMGVIVFFLAIFSMIINWKDRLVRYLTILVAVATLISFGRTFPLVYDLVFHYFPFFDKFRVPSMILVLVQLSFPILAGLAIAKIISLKNNNDKKYENLVRNIFFGLSAIFVLTLLLASPIKSWFISRIAESGQKGSQLQQIQDYMANMFLTDARLAFFFSAATFGLIYAYTKSAVSKDLMIGLIIVLSFIDILRIDNRGETYTEAKNIQQLFQKPEYVSVIESLNDKSVFRILNLKQDGSLGSIQQNSNFNVYFLLQDLYGYSGVKPRAYQDYMDVLGSPANPTLWRMANTKYIILDKQINFAGLIPVHSGEKTYVYQNQNALPRAYFVNSVQKASPIEILNEVKNNQFDPKDVAYLESVDIKVDKPDSTVFVEIEKYGDENIYLKVKASGNNFLFLGDTYFPEGWKAYIDGNETTIYRANHNFRGIIVPKGEYRISFSYAPVSFFIGKYLSLFFSGFIVIGFIISLYIKRKKLLTYLNINERGK